MMSRFEFSITQLSFIQKLDLMEMLWADMIANEKNMESPGWHKAILDDRENALDTGKITVSNWEEAKERIKKNVS
jgi:putative addiction module component (TIGR02574 family)